MHDLREMSCPLVTKKTLYIFWLKTERKKLSFFFILVLQFYSYRSMIRCLLVGTASTMLSVLQAVDLHRESFKVPEVEIVLYKRKSGSSMGGEAVWRRKVSPGANLLATVRSIYQDAAENLWRNWFHDRRNQTTIVIRDMIRIQREPGMKASDRTTVGQWHKQQHEKLTQYGVDASSRNLELKLEFHPKETDNIELYFHLESHQAKVATRHLVQQEQRRIPLNLCLISEKGAGLESKIIHKF